MSTRALSDGEPVPEQITCVAPSVIWPLLIHTRQQMLIERVYLRRRALGAPVIPRIAVRLAGLLEQPRLLTWKETTTHDDGIELRGFDNPAITLNPSDLESSPERAAPLELYVEDQLTWCSEATIRSPRCWPIAAEATLSLAALVMPFAAEVIDLVRQARERSGMGTPRRGFPAMSPRDAAGALYRHLARAREPFFAWESGGSRATHGDQMVRLPQQVIVEGQGTCIDLALVLAAMIEHIRRQPIVLLLDSGGGTWHAVAGVRLRDDDFSDVPVLHGLPSVRRSCDPKRVVLYDPDALIDGADPSEADEQARQRLRECRSARLIDIQASREAGVWPLAVADPPRVVLGNPYSGGKQIIWHMQHQDLPSEFVEEVVTGRAVFVLGDTLDKGHSASRAALTAALAAECGEDGFDLLLAGSQLEATRGLTAVADIVMRVVGNAAESGPYEDLAALPVRTVVSFHPDRTLERLLSAAGFEPLVDDADLSALRSREAQKELYLLGGSALSGKGLVLTYRQQTGLLRRIELLARGLRDRLASGTVVLIGCDLTDPNLTTLLIEATKHLSQVRPAYVVGDGAPVQWVQPLRVLDVGCVALLRRLGEAAVHVPRAPSRPADRPRPLTRSPYKYLDYYDAEDRQLFFGRGDDARRIAGEIRAAEGRIAILFGRSGVGKTSLVKTLVSEHLDTTRVVTTYVRCGADPEHAIVRALRDIMDPAPRGSGLRELLRSLRESSGREHVVFLDQAEEMLIKTGSSVLAAFFTTLQEALADPGTPLRIVLILREDYLARLGVYLPHVPRLLAAAHQLAELSRDGAREAIVRPAVMCGLDVDDDLVEAILDDLSPDSILPAHLQIVCHRLYEECRGLREMTLEQYTRLGRAAEILRQHLEQAMHKLPEPLEATARVVLTSLVTSETTRELMALPDILERSGHPIEQVQAALHELIHAHRLVREVPGEPVTFELAHESLAQGISAWLDAAEAKVRAVQEILLQEVVSVRKNIIYRIPTDRLSLIEEYTPRLMLNAEAQRIIGSEYAVRGLAPPDAWRAHVMGLSGAERLLLVERASRISVDALRAAIRSLGSDITRELPTTPLSFELANAAAQLFVDGHVAGVAVGRDLLTVDNSGRLDQSLAHRSAEIGDEAWREIAACWHCRSQSGIPEFQSHGDLGLALGYIVSAIVPAQSVAQPLRRVMTERRFRTLFDAVRLAESATPERSPDLAPRVVQAIRELPESDRALVDVLTVRWLIAVTDPTESAIARLRDACVDTLGNGLDAIFADNGRAVLVRAWALLLRTSRIWMRTVTSSPLSTERVIVVCCTLMIGEEGQSLLSPLIDFIRSDPACEAETVLWRVIHKVGDATLMKLLSTLEEHELPDPGSVESDEPRLSVARLIRSTVSRRHRPAVLKALIRKGPAGVATAPDFLDGAKRLTPADRRIAASALHHTLDRTSGKGRFGWFALLMVVEPRSATLPGMVRRVCEACLDASLIKQLSDSEHQALLALLAELIGGAEPSAPLDAIIERVLDRLLSKDRGPGHRDLERALGRRIAPHAHTGNIGAWLRRLTDGVRLGILESLPLHHARDPSVAKALMDLCNAQDSDLKGAAALMLARTGQRAGIRVALTAIKSDALEVSMREYAESILRDSPPSLLGPEIKELFVARSSRATLFRFLSDARDIAWIAQAPDLLDWLMEPRSLEALGEEAGRGLLPRLMPDLGRRLKHVAKTGPSAARRIASKILTDYYGRDIARVSERLDA